MVRSVTASFDSWDSLQLFIRRTLNRTGSSLLPQQHRLDPTLQALPSPQAEQPSPALAAGSRSAAVRCVAADRSPAQNPATEA